MAATAVAAVWFDAGARGTEALHAAKAATMREHAKGYFMGAVISAPRGAKERLEEFARGLSSSSGQHEKRGACRFFALRAY
jgi:hypothetical protein